MTKMYVHIQCSYDKNVNIHRKFYREATSISVICFTLFFATAFPISYYSLLKFTTFYTPQHDSGGV